MSKLMFWTVFASFTIAIFVARLVFLNDDEASDLQSEFFGYAAATASALFASWLS